MSAASLEAPRGGALGWLLALLRRPAGWLLGAGLCMTPLTAVLAQGWLMGRMRRLAIERARRAGAAPVWTREAAAPSGALRRLATLAQEGAAASVTVFIGLAPFTVLALLSWWGGWENSFGKGYEQSWVGPSLGLISVALGLPLLARLPLALAHQAVEGRMAAFFERRKVGRIMRYAGWEHLALAACFTLAALPLFAAKGLPVFIEQIRPGFDTLTEEQARNFAWRWRFFAALYLFATLWILRGWSARLYAKARLRVEKSEAAEGAAPRGLLQSLQGGLRMVLLTALWFGLVAQIYVGQFLNHDWAEWLNPPLVALPVVPGLGG